VGFKMKGLNWRYNRVSNKIKTIDEKITDAETKHQNKKVDRLQDKKVKLKNKKDKLENKKFLKSQNEAPVKRSDLDAEGKALYDKYNK